MSTLFFNDLPNGWACTTLASCTEILDSQRVPINAKERKTRISGKLESELYPYYGATGQVGWIDDYLFDEELVLLGEDGAPFFDFSKDTAYLIKGKSWVNNHAHVLRAKIELMSNQLLCHYLNIFDYHGYLTGTTRLKLNQSAMRKILVPLPPLAEQHRIVAKLEVLFTQLDTAVDSLKKAQGQLQRYRRSILEAAFKGGLTREQRNRREEKAGKDIEEYVDAVWIERKAAAINKRTSPKHWEVIQLKEAVNLRREKVQPKDSSENLNFVGLKHIDSGVSILKRWGDASEVKSTKSRFCPNDVLYGKLRAYLDKAVIAEMAGICSADILVFTANSKMIPRFLVYLLHSQTFRNYAIATSSGITLPRTSWNALGEFTFALPPLAEQEQIVSELERCFSIADGVEATIGFELVRAEHLRQSILKQAFSGKLVPQDPNDEPASVLLEKIQVQKKQQQPKQKKKTATKSKTQDDDNYPLLTLAGALECNDDSIGDASRVEWRVC